MVELGHPEQALERASRLAATVEASGQIHELVWVRALELATRLARGEPGSAPHITDWLIDTARTTAATDVTVEVLAAAASGRLAAGKPQQACTLLTEVEQTPGAREVSPYARQLQGMLRTTLVAGDPDLARRLAEGIEPRYPLHEHAICTARAQLAEHAGEHADAAALYGEAVGRWHEFGNVPERAYALLGHGRCLTALGQPTEEPLRDAHALFASMGYKPALAETEALLSQSEAAAL